MDNIFRFVVLRQPALAAMADLRDPFLCPYTSRIPSMPDSFRNRIAAALQAGRTEAAVDAAGKLLSCRGKSARGFVDRTPLDNLFATLPGLARAGHRTAVAGVVGVAAGRWPISLASSTVFAALRNDIADYLVASILAPQGGDVDGAAHLVCCFETVERALSPVDAPYRSWRTPLLGCVIVLPFECPQAYEATGAARRLPTMYTLHPVADAAGVRAGVRD